MFAWFEIVTIALLIERRSSRMHAVVAALVYCILVVGSAESVFSHRCFFSFAFILDKRI